MSNPNTVTVYSPEGDPFEMSRANARDLCNHRNWSMNPVAHSTATAPATKEIDHGSPASERSVEAPVPEKAEVEAEPAADEAEVEVEAEEEVVEEVAADEDEAAADQDNASAPFTTEEQFADLVEREDVVAYLADHFPDFRPHHKAGRDGLVAKAIELAAE